MPTDWRHCSLLTCTSLSSSEQGKKDKLNVVQVEQDLAMCASELSSLICQPIGAQLLIADVIAMFRFAETVRGVADEMDRHYRLVPPRDVTRVEWRGRWPIHRQGFRCALPHRYAEVQRS